MKVLLDTHSFLWYCNAETRLSAFAKETIEDVSNQPCLSMASIWEMAIKVSMGKLLLQHPFEIFIPHLLQLNGISTLPIELHHTYTLAALPFHHRDPFDRLIIAQGISEEIPIISVDAIFDLYPIQRLW